MLIFMADEPVLRGVAKPTAEDALDAAVLWDAGVALNHDRTRIRDRYGRWYAIAWCFHDCRYCCSAAHIDAVLRVAAHQKNAPSHKNRNPSRIN